MGETLELPLTWNKATAKPLLDNKRKDENVISQWITGSLKYTDFEWCNWIPGMILSLTIDLQSQEKLNKLAIGCITRLWNGSAQTENDSRRSF